MIDKIVLNFGAFQRPVRHKQPDIPHKNSPDLELAQGLLPKSFKIIQGGNGNHEHRRHCFCPRIIGTGDAHDTGALSWSLLEWLHRGKPTTLGAASGAVAGLVAITPASGLVGPLSSIVIGLMAGGICYGGILLKSKLGYDDSLDVVGIHGLGGTWGALATGLFASTKVNTDGANGLFFGNPGQLWSQVVSVVATMAFAFTVTYVILR
ncbi:MAG: ammonium transporter, partial [Deltaproteobacteria bacterium]|nr:ammonium transporter [Deltaproteobacteria bacterium]